MSTNAFSAQNFSLVLGGPLFQLFRRAHLSGDALELLNRRIIIIAGIAWIPLLLLTILAGTAFGGAVEIPFIEDVESHVRFLVALPILIGAELIVHRRLRPAVSQFIERRIVTPEDTPKFERAIESTLRLRNSPMTEILLILIVYSIGIWVWIKQFSLGAASWYAIPDGTRMRLTPAGYWFVFVSVPIFQFILLRWYFRFFLWFYFLFRVSRLNLKLIPIHVDRTGGLGFLGTSTHAFAPILVAQGAILAGLIAGQILHAGAVLTDFRVQVVAFLAFFIVATLLPLTVFAPRLAEAKRAGLGAFGRLASRYGSRFEGKWLHDSSTDDELLGSGDIQSLADLGNSFGVVQEMRLFPFGWRDVTRLASMTAIPFLPLLLTIFSLEEFASYVLKAIF
ncbi:hypothetical protein HNQ60_005442 [Povalibacter uvarum]|uniref:Uncharacterized protein n=1 Tax=Povalibacter uvarum TaxID=732238 RepID=A0A841HWD8_9GAMM|nr:hypothetical protein [Povalibacter uvarum]MBB6096520.1 hypothetical protein [Povalibacter uvarum]